MKPSHDIQRWQGHWGPEGVRAKMLTSGLKKLNGGLKSIAR